MTFFQTHDVGFEVVVNGERLPGIAKWEDVLKIYESDKKSLIRVLGTVTDSHLHPDTNCQLGQLCCTNNVQDCSSIDCNDGVCR